MTKQTGLGAYLYVDGVDLSGDVASFNLGAPSGLMTVTGINKSAQERIYGMFDGMIDYVGYFNDATGAEFETMKTMPSTDRIACFLLGQAQGNVAAGLIAKQSTYDPSRGNDGSFTHTVKLEGNGYGLDYCQQLTAGPITHASATSSAGVQAAEAAATAFGLSGYCQVISLGSGSPTVKIQSSSDDGGSDAYSDVSGATFGVVAAGTGYHFVTSSLTASIEQYLRVTTTGTFTNLVFLVIVCRYPVTL